MVIEKSTMCLFSVFIEGGTERSGSKTKYLKTPRIGEPFLNKCVLTSRYRIS